MKKLNLLVSGICLSASLLSAETLVWTSGQLGGGWYTMAAGMAKFIEKNDSSLNLKIVPGGGTSNPSKVEKGKSDLGLGLDTVTYLAANGKDIYKKKHVNISLIAMGLSDIMFHVIRAKDAKYKNIGDLLKNGKDENIAVTKAGSSDEKIFSWIMKYYGTSYADLKKRGFKVIHGNYTEISSQYKDGLVDYAVMNLGTPGAAVIDMLLSRDGQITDLPKDLSSSLKKEWGYNTGTLGANTYSGQIASVLTGKMSTIMFARNSVSTNTVYNITKAICENEADLEKIHSSMKNFSCKTATLNAPLPVHPGAAKYYREMGYIK
ncbi:MAG: hypothetical protein COA66_07775 [Arcobacter sp.]|nr:MAG: hypothetical protein COA66_07775 [Arcobacter sp.]